MLKACQGSWETRPDIIIYFGLNLREQGISLQLKGILAKDFREQWNLLIENNGEEVKFSREHANPTPTPSSLRGSSIMKVESMSNVSLNYRSVNKLLHQIVLHGWGIKLKKC